MQLRLFDSRVGVPFFQLLLARRFRIDSPFPRAVPNFTPAPAGPRQHLYNPAPFVFGRAGLLLFISKSKNINIILTYINSYDRIALSSLLERRGGINPETDSLINCLNAQGSGGSFTNRIIEVQKPALDRPYNRCRTAFTIYKMASILAVLHPIEAPETFKVGNSILEQPVLKFLR